MWRSSSATMTGLCQRGVVRARPTPASRASGRCGSIGSSPGRAITCGSTARSFERRSAGSASTSGTIAAVIAGAHTIIFAEHAERAREFLHDVLGFEGVDAGEGWLIFALPPGEVAVHPGSGWGRAPGHHALFLMCHDIEETVAGLSARASSSCLRSRTRAGGGSRSSRSPAPARSVCTNPGTQAHSKSSLSR